MKDVVVGGNWKMLEKIRDGSEIYEGVDIHSREKVAIKRERTGTKRCVKLLNEYHMYKHLQGTDVGIPSVKWSGVKKGYRYLVIQRLGPSLEDLLKCCSGSFTLKTVLMLADQIISTLMHMQTKGVIHRDIKPEHLLMGVGSDASKVYLIDFGLAKFFRDPASGEHIAYRENVSFVGTLDYASLYTHFGIEQSRRDDGESFFYVLMYLLQGCLPWQGLRVESDAKKYNEELCKYKFVCTENEELEKWFPVEFPKCLNVTRYKDFYEAPAFLSIRVAFRKLFENKGYAFDLLYDWVDAEEEDNIKSGTLSEKLERILATQDSSSDDHSRYPICDDLSSLKLVSNDPDKRRLKNQLQRRSTAHSHKVYIVGE